MSQLFNAGEPLSDAEQLLRLRALRDSLFASMVPDLHTAAGFADAAKLVERIRAEPDNCGLMYDALASNLELIKTGAWQRAYAWAAAIEQHLREQVAPKA
ncbi:hypothetical protein [Piscinibacter koreensis]|uniref:Uncharacterized protein n=1 Tax=Piscinibacter koreensis TaxID=2742824 RepID=A0A7Y6NQW8_9BURK|nr:hypothetical protein [Schlegelella koreensis]NUZ07649.1 hypothetical protein [Schlegelella koreensis]